MKSTIGWILAIVFGLILLFLLPSLWMMGRFWMGSYGGMMGVVSTPCTHLAGVVCS